MSELGIVAAILAGSYMLAFLATGERIMAWCFLVLMLTAGTFGVLGAR